MKNWFGKTPHPTDDMIHWTEQNQEELSVELRDAYDRIVKAGFQKPLDILLEASYDSGNMDEHDNNAGADL